MLKCKRLAFASIQRQNAEQLCFFPKNVFLFGKNKADYNSSILSLYFSLIKVHILICVIPKVNYKNCLLCADIHSWSCFSSFLFIYSVGALSHGMQTSFRSCQELLALVAYVNFSYFDFQIVSKFLFFSFSFQFFRLLLLIASFL